MSIKAIGHFEPEWYTLESERNEENPARFKLRGLNGSEQAQIMPEIIQDDSEMQLSARALAMLIEFGVLDWENITDNDGARIPFPPCGLEVQNSIGYAVQAELARRLFELTFTTTEEKKIS